MTKLTETAETVLKKRKYYHEGEENWDDIAARVAGEFAQSVEEELLFYKKLSDLDWLPNSPCLMNAGTEIKSYSACFVLPVEDSIESIFKYYSDAALISKSGGGVGANFSSIRPALSTVGSTGGVASGPLSFIKGQDALTEVIKQGGKRRGANMGILQCDHPDILEFVRAKDTPGFCENFNLSVGITDDFMEDVDTKKRWPDGSCEGHGVCSTEEWDEITKNAALWDELCERAWSSAEPGVLFMDTIEKGNAVPHLGKLEATNPCGGQPLLPYENCCLGSINLSNMVCEKWELPIVDHETMEPAKGIAWAKLKEATESLCLFLNRVLDESSFAIPECGMAMEATRKIGIGIMGLHDMLIQLEIPYDSEEGRDAAREVMKFIAECADEKSSELGRAEGYYKGLYLTSNGFPDKDGSSFYPSPIRRNANLTTIAPTGTLSMIADCSSGCEPYYAPVVTKTVLEGAELTLYNKWVEEFARRDGIPPEEALDKYHHLFKDVHEIHWSDHVKMQAALQEYVDSSISKTINMPANATVEDVKDAYELAYTLGCKGITVYRDGSRGSGVLSGGGLKQDKAPEDGEGLTLDDLPTPYKLELDDVLKAKRYRVRDIDGKKVYFTVCTQGGYPVEVFARLPEEVQDSSWHTISRLLSLCMRYNIPLDDITKQLRKSSGSVSDNPAKLARILDEYKEDDSGTTAECPECGEELVFQSGCSHCESCGYEKCS